LPSFVQFSNPVRYFTRHRKRRFAEQHRPESRNCAARRQRHDRKNRSVCIDMQSPGQKFGALL